MKRLVLVPLSIVILSFSLFAQQIENNALVLINGKVSIQNLNSIDPNNVESLTVLKDQAALDVYGKAGKNGVILVETKDKSSVETSSEALVIVNEEFYTSDFDAIDPIKIDTVIILKGDKATELYGDLVKNGVILITTTDHSYQKKE